MRLLKMKSVLTIIIGFNWFLLVVNGIWTQVPYLRVRILLVNLIRIHFSFIVSVSEIIEDF